MENFGLKRKDLIYPDLSYKIIGALFGTANEIGVGHKEKFYQKALAQVLNEKGIKYKEQLPSKIYYKEKYIGIYYFDFLIEDKIVLEIKVKSYFSKKDMDQIYSYLKANNLKLGILAHFTKSGVRIKRIVNII
jgi:GxxExxY protein